MLKRYQDVLIGLFFMILSAVYFIASTKLPEATVSKLGPDFMPQTTGLITFGLGLVLVIMSYGKAKQSTTQAKAENVEYKPVILTIAVFLVYTMLIEPIGFLFSTVIYLFLQFNISAPKDIKNKKLQVKFVISSVLTAIIVYYLFRNAFNVMLPEGILG